MQNATTTLLSDFVSITFPRKKYNLNILIGKKYKTTKNENLGKKIIPCKKILRQQLR
jgi:hypothetical protein